jgi:hypothetical protein
VIDNLRRKIWRFNHRYLFKRDEFDWPGKILRGESEEIVDALRFEGFENPQAFSDEMNAALKAFWEDHADELGVPVGAECLVTDEFQCYLLYCWGWKKEYLPPVLKAGHVIVHYGGAGASFTLPDGGWIGCVAESFDMVKRMRNAWVESTQ